MSVTTVRVELSGGAELLFGQQKSLSIQLEAGSPRTLRDLLQHLHDHHLKERPELFLENEGKGPSVRPGILVLVNEADWELCGQLDYTLEDRDVITFISTLHGG